MRNVTNTQLNGQIKVGPSIKGNDGLIIEAHNSNNMKLDRPKVGPNDILITLPTQKSFSDRDATQKIRQINNDIYQGTKKEKSKHEFNLKRYFTIFGIIGLLTAAVAYFRRGR